MHALQPVTTVGNAIEQTADRRMIDRLFGGKLTPLVAHLAEREQLTDQDIAEIEALLKDLKQ